MSVTKHIFNILLSDTSVFSKGAVKGSLLRGQAVFNFAFIRRYKSADIEYLDNRVKKEHRRFYKDICNHESHIKLSAQYYLYLMKKEKFMECLRELFSTTKTMVSKLSKYVSWKQHYDAGLATACFIFYNHEELNSFCGRTISNDMVHKYGIMDKLCNLSDIPLTHTTVIDYHSMTSSQNSESASEIEDEEAFVDLTQSVRLPSYQKLEVSSDFGTQKTTNHTGSKSVHSYQIVSLLYMLSKAFNSYLKFLIHFWQLFGNSNLHKSWLVIGQALNLSHFSYVNIALAILIWPILIH